MNTLHSKPRRADFLNAKMHSRRKFLCLCGSTAATLPFLHGLSGCATVQVANSLEQVGLANGCVVGDVTPGGAVVWVRAQEESLVSVHYGRDPSLTAMVFGIPCGIESVV